MGWSVSAKRQSCQRARLCSSLYTVPRFCPSYLPRPKEEVTSSPAHGVPFLLFPLTLG